MALRAAADLLSENNAVVFCSRRDGTAMWFATNAAVAELVDAPVSKTGLPLASEGSTPSCGMF